MLRFLTKQIRVSAVRLVLEAVFGATTNSTPPDPGLEEFLRKVLDHMDRGIISWFRPTKSFAWRNVTKTIPRVDLSLFKLPCN